MIMVLISTCISYGCVVNFTFLCNFQYIDDSHYIQKGITLWYHCSYVGENESNESE